MGILVSAREHLSDALVCCAGIAQAVVTALVVLSLSGKIQLSGDQNWLWCCAATGVLVAVVSA